MKTVEEGSFWDHLEELRRRLFVVSGTLAGTVCLSFLFSRRLMQLVVSRSPMELQTLAPSEAFAAHLDLSLVAGFLAGSPVFFHQFWGFIAPGLYEDERKKVLAAAGACLLLFAAGVAFAWFLLLTPALDLFMGFEHGVIHGGWSLSNFVSFLGRFLIVFGMAFQLPVLVFMLVALGVLTPDLLASYRRHSIILLLVAAAVLTPPDPLTQVMLALPLYLLFELSLLVAGLVYGRKK